MLHEIGNPQPDGAGVASLLLGVEVASLSFAIQPVALPTNRSLLAMISYCMSWHAAAIARFFMYLLAACRVNVVAFFCVFLAVIFDSGMCADAA